MRAALLLLGLFGHSAVALAATDQDDNIHCSAYYQILSVAGDQPDISRAQASKAFYVFVTRAGDTPETEDAVAQRMVELAKEIKKPISVENIADFRGRYDAKCAALLNAL